MNKELAEKMRQARSVIFEVENKEIIMHQNKDKLTMMQKDYDKLVQELKISYLIKWYIIWGIISIGIGFWPALYIGGCISALFGLVPEEGNIKQLFFVGYTFVLVIYTFIYVLVVAKKKRKCKKNLEQLKTTEDVMKKEIVSVISWCREELRKIDFIPKEYQYGIAIDFFYKVLNNGRADSMKECMNLYEEQIHRWKLESNTANMKNVANARNAAMGRS